MNFKINLWTLLFFLAAGALSYVYLYEKDNPPLCKINEDTGVIGSDTAIGGIMAFESYLDSIFVKDSVLHTKSTSFDIPMDSIPQENRKVKYFRITKPCELGRILSEASDVDSVFAYLTLTENTEYVNHSKGGVQGMIDLVFKVKTNHKKGESNADEYGFKYYDFTNPCKPLCGK